MATLCVVCGFDRLRVDAFTCGKASCLAALSQIEREAELAKAKPFEPADLAPCAWCGRYTADAVELDGVTHPICAGCSRNTED